MSRPRVEPSADHRAAAVDMMQMFQSWKDAGFTDEQALRLLLQWMDNVARRSSD